MALTSSMQSLDSVLLLIALRRYPHALCTCTGAIESAIKSSRLRSAVEKCNGLKSVLDVARRESDLPSFPPEQLKALGDTRNRITHQGFSPRDDPETVGLLIEVGIPFLALCYWHFYSFDFWDAILQEYAHQWRIATGVFQRVKEELPDSNKTYCLNGLSHLIRWNLKDNFLADWEIKATGQNEGIEIQFEVNRAKRQRFEGLFDTPWVFDCPLCGEPEAVVCELDESELESRKVAPLRMACVNCGFAVSKAEPHLSEALLTASTAKEKETILKEFGVI